MTSPMLSLSCPWGCLYAFGSKGPRLYGAYGGGAAGLLPGPDFESM